MTRTAKCCCGACSIGVEGEPTVNGLCHCDNCKRRTGGAFGWSVYFGDGQVTGQEGPLRAYEVGSQMPATRWFCSECGSTLLWKTDFFPGQTGVAGGCFVDSIPDPTFAASSDKRKAWVGLPAHWPALA